MEDIRGSGAMPGVGFSPIQGRDSDIEEMLRALFGGADMKTGVHRMMPSLQIRGVPPSEIFQNWLATRPGGAATRPDLTQVFAPDQMPDIAQQPNLPIAPVRPTPRIVSEPAPQAAPAEAPSLADIFPASPSVGGPGPSEAPAEGAPANAEPALDIRSPSYGETPAAGEPGGPGGAAWEFAPPGMQFEEAPSAAGSPNHADTSGPQTDADAERERNAFLDLIMGEGYGIR